MLDPTTNRQNRRRQRRLALAGLLLTTGMMTALGIAAEYQNPFVSNRPKRLPAVTKSKFEESKAESSQTNSPTNHTLESEGTGRSRSPATRIASVAGLFQSFTPVEPIAQVSTTAGGLPPRLNPAAPIAEKTQTPLVTVIDAKPKIIVQPRNVAGQKQAAAQKQAAGPKQSVEPKPAAEPKTVVASASAQHSAPVSWLRSTTSSATHEVSRRLLNQASHEYSVGAWLSAETSAWEALRWAAESIDISQRENRSLASQQMPSSSLGNLTLARNAIREARDFAGHYGALDVHAIRRMVMSHQTKVLENQSLEGLTATDAVDRYLDDARVRLSRIAAQSIDAAAAMDLLAAIYLGRGDARTLPSSTALCLRRAALQGQPMNASLAARLGMHLADLGLFQEARWALEHSLSIQPDANTANSLAAVMWQLGEDADAQQLMASIPNRPSQGSDSIPEITRLSPQEFAAVSTQVMQVSGKQQNRTVTRAGTVPRSTSNPLADEISEPHEPEKTNVVRRMFASVMNKFW